MREKSRKKGAYHISREASEGGLIGNAEGSISNQVTATATGLGIGQVHGAEQGLPVEDLDGFGELDVSGEGTGVGELTVHGHGHAGVGGVGDLDGFEAHVGVVEDGLGHLREDDKKTDGYSDGDNDDSEDGAEDPVLAPLVEGAGGWLVHLIVLFELLVVFFAFIIRKLLDLVGGSRHCMCIINDA